MKVLIVVTSIYSDKIASSFNVNCLLRFWLVFISTLYYMQYRDENIIRINKLRNECEKVWRKMGLKNDSKSM